MVGVEREAILTPLRSGENVGRGLIQPFGFKVFFVGFWWFCFRVAWEAERAGFGVVGFGGEQERGRRSGAVVLGVVSHGRVGGVADGLRWRFGDLYGCIL